ncbi:1,2-beta-fructan 1F-fructosyltransferase [Tanacetum coccineum]
MLRALLIEYTMFVVAATASRKTNNKRCRVAHIETLCFCYYNLDGTTIRKHARNATKRARAVRIQHDKGQKRVTLLRGNKVYNKSLALPALLIQRPLAGSSVGAIVCAVVVSRAKVLEEFMPEDAHIKSNGRVCGDDNFSKDCYFFIFYASSNQDETGTGYYIWFSSRMHAVPGTDMWECVDFYPVSLTNDSAFDMAAYGPGLKHVIKESWEGHGMDWFFASKRLFDPLKKRRVTWGYVGESDSPDQDLSRRWTTLYNVARTVVLDRKNGTHLLHWPVEEIESLRSNVQKFNEIKLEPGSIGPLDIGSATQVDQDALKATTTEVNNGYGCTTSLGATQKGSLGPFRVAVLADGTLSELTPVYFYIAKNIDGSLARYFCTDKLRSSLDYDGERVVYGSTVPVLDGEELTLRLLMLKPRAPQRSAG